MAPVLIYDDHCGFCRRWAAAAKRRLGGLVLVKGSEAAGRYPGLSPEDLQKSVLLLDREGALRRGAAAVFVLLAEAGWPAGRTLYESHLVFRRAGDFGYWVAARVRRPLSLVLDLLLGPPRDL